MFTTTAKLANGTARKIFPYSTDKVSEVQAVQKAVVQHVKNGGHVYVKFLDGARAGTIGRVNNVDWETLYSESRNTYGRKAHLAHTTWTLEFDGRKNTVEVQMAYWSNQNLEVVFDAPGTTWVYTTTPREQKAKKKLYDHFGQEIVIGMVCMFVARNSKNDFRLRFGKLIRTSEVGTMWFKPFRTREDHREAEEIKVENHLACSVTVLDDDVRRKVMMSKLAL